MQLITDDYLMNMAPENAFPSLKIVAHCGMPNLLPIAGWSTESSECTGLVKLYQNDNFGGWEGKFGNGHFPTAEFTKTPSPTPRAQNNQVSSIKVPAGCRAIIYQNDFDSTGWIASFGPGEYTMAEMLARGAANDQVSALKVIDADGPGYSRVGNGWCLNADGNRIKPTMSWMQVAVGTDGSAELCQDLCDDDKLCMGYISEYGTKCDLIRSGDQNYSGRPQWQGREMSV